MLIALAGCATTPSPEPEASAPPPAAASPPPPVPTSPPVDLSGRWKLTAAAGGACVMTFGEAPAAVQGTIAPEGGCPGNFFTSRKWTFERDTLVLRDHKGQSLAQLSFTGGHFEGQDSNGGSLVLSR
ncbi:MAG TPA: AprI/Inh family metalloprotease inhibitor [Xanthobacteraceae bacterium]|nr:AprI/Inh family metalloprotease inhibitor [Xanthobacteraceae bacterium]